MNKRTAPFFFALLFSAAAFSQTKTKMSIGVSVNPFYTGSINSSSSSEPMNAKGVTFKQYNDSIGKNEGTRLSFGATVWGNYMLNTDWTIQAGIGYADIGFQRVQRNIKYSDYTYPGIGTGPNSGRVLDLSNSDKSIEYNYRYQYIQLPFFFNYTFRNKRNLFFSFALCAGGSVNILVDHRITANLVNFTVEDESSYGLDSTGYKGSTLGANFFLGGRLDYKFDKQFSFMLQPFFGMSPFSVSSSPISVYPYWFGFNVGLLYHLKKE